MPTAGSGVASADQPESDEQRDCCVCGSDEESTLRGERDAVVPDDRLLDREAGAHEAVLVDPVGDAVREEVERDHRREQSREDDGDGSGGVPEDGTDAEREDGEQAEIDTCPEYGPQRLVVRERDGTIRSASLIEFY